MDNTIETRPLDSKLPHQHVERSDEVEECPVRLEDISPRFIVNLPAKKQSGKNMKLRKSRFRFGSFAFGHSTSNLASTSTHSPPSLPTYTPTPDPFFVHPELRLKEESKFRSSSTASLIRRSSSRVDAIHCSTTPVLLAVRKRSCSDSGLDETSNSSQSCSPKACERKNPIIKVSSKSNSKSEGSSRMGGGFFRIFNKSATLLFKHPTTELNPNKPYKGTVTTSREQHAVKKKASTLGASRRTPEEYMYFRQHQKWPSLIRRDGDSPTIPVGTSSSLSSLNSSSILQNHQAYSSGDDSGRPSATSGDSVSGTKTGLSVSSNSVISTCSSENEDCDSGAFSRTSSPGLRNISSSALLNTSSASISRLPPTEPLVAPSLVLAACLEYGVPICDFEGDCVDANLVLSCLNAAAREEQQRSRRPRPEQDVSVTIGANTKLTITQDPDNAQVRRSGQLRRSRSGLPVLGTSVLQRTDSPSKKLTQRNKISTVYLNPVGSPSSRGASRTRLTRSESVVTVSGVAPRRMCDCTEQVTVNGQHHCCDLDRNAATNKLIGDFEKFMSLQQTSITEVHSPPDTQPNSLINL